MKYKNYAINPKILAKEYFIVINWFGKENVIVVQLYTQKGLHNLSEQNLATRCTLFTCNRTCEFSIVWPEEMRNIICLDLLANAQQDALMSDACAQLRRVLFSNTAGPHHGRRFEIRERETETSLNKSNAHVCFRPTHLPPVAIVMCSHCGWN